MQTTSAPTLATTSDVISARFEGQMVFNVRLPDGGLKHAFTASMVGICKNKKIKCSGIGYLNNIAQLQEEEQNTMNRPVNNHKPQSPYRSMSI